MGKWLREHPFWGLMLGKMAYPFMFIAAFMMCPIFNVIPGHPILSFLLSFLIVECGAMVLTHLIMLLTLIGAAFSALCCMFLLGIVFLVIMTIIGPDSVQYFILLTAIFSAISLPLCFLNLIFDGGRRSIPGLSCIVAGILNAHTAAIYILVLRGAWEVSCFPKSDIVIEDKILYNSYLGGIIDTPFKFASVPGAVVFYIVFAVICLGAFVATILFRKKWEQCSKGLACGILQGM